MPKPAADAGRTGAQWLSPSARRKGDWDVPFRILSTATLLIIETEAARSTRSMPGIEAAELPVGNFPLADVEGTGELDLAQALVRPSPLLAP